MKLLVSSSHSIGVADNVITSLRIPTLAVLPLLSLSYTLLFIFFSSLLLVSGVSKRQTARLL